MAGKKVMPTWHLKQIWDSPEIRLKRQLKRNPLYPFHETEEDFVFDVTNSSLHLGLVLLTLSSIGGTIYWNEMGKFSNEVFDTAFVLFILWSFRLITYNWNGRKIVLEKDGQSYFFYIGKSLVYRGEIHNVYLRLRGQNSSNGKTYYRLVLNGYRIEEQQITAMTPNKTALEQQAKKLAFRLNINYFDSEDVSVGHIVRHTNMEMYFRPKKKSRGSTPKKRITITRATLDAFY